MNDGLTISHQKYYIDLLGVRQSFRYVYMYNNNNNNNNNK